MKVCEPVSSVTTMWSTAPTSMNPETWCDPPAEAVIHVPQVHEWLSPIVAAPAIQLFAHSLALAGGGDPEQPRGLSKITRTL